MPPNEEKMRMKTITQGNLKDFKPDYGDYKTRVEEFARIVGVESDTAEQDFDTALDDWDRSSAIGLTDAERDVVRLYFSVAMHNRRCDSDRYVHPEHGGNTAEHPIFMGLAFDECMRKAGFGPDTFDPESPQSLQAARLAQRVHAMSIVHDAGELVDISFSEQQQVGASRKEPDEEALVGPFQFKLAAYALSVGKPELYVDGMKRLKENALAAKEKYYAMALRGEITGDEFVTEFGKVVGENIDEGEKHIDENAISPEYRKAMDTLTELFLSAEEKRGISGVLLGLLDRYQGFAHYSRYAGKAAKDYGLSTDVEDAEERMFNRLFGDGRAMSFTLADSATVIGEINFAQRYIAPAFAALEEEPEETRGMAERLVRTMAADMLRARIELVQKGPAFLDFSGKNADEPAVRQGEQERDEAFAQRLETQRAMNKQALDGLRERSREGRPVEALDGIVDSKAVIAVLEKTAAAIESGTFTPASAKGNIIPNGEGSRLPEALQVTPEEIRAATRRYPLDAAKDFRGDRFRGEPVRIATRPEAGGGIGR